MTPAPKVDLLDPSFIDTSTSARIPSAQSFFLHQAATKHNIHNHCDHLNFSAVCTIDNIFPKHCSKGFAGEIGHVGVQIYVTHRRQSCQNEGETPPWTDRCQGGAPIMSPFDNLWAVPYASNLLILFHGYLYVELCVFKIG